MQENLQGSAKCRAYLRCLKPRNNVIITPQTPVFV